VQGLDYIMTDLSATPASTSSSPSSFPQATPATPQSHGTQTQPSAASAKASTPTWSSQRSGQYQSSKQRATLTCSETSRKPDEVYAIIERLAPHGRKLELFGRKHNTRPGWLTLGNQLGTSQVAEADLHGRLVTRYPNQQFELVGAS
jgi:hypothetical protein